MVARITPQELVAQPDRFNAMPTRAAERLSGHHVRYTALTRKNGPPR